MTESIILGVIGSGALATLISGIFNLIVNRKGRLKAIEDQLLIIAERQNTSEKDALRTQLLVMISDFPDEVAEILKLAEHYFGVLRGDWYMTAIFNKWLEGKGIARPEWFKE